MTPVHLLEWWTQEDESGLAMAKAKPTKKPAKRAAKTVPANTRYEYRVWGEHRKACRKLSKMASEETTEKIEDCYFLVDDPTWNAKVRGDALKVKELVDTRKGFEQWATTWHTDNENLPAPFDDLYDELRLDRPARGKSWDLPKQVSKLDDESPRPVFVTKRRRRYRVGGIRAESTEVRIKGSCERLQTLAIEGDDLESLLALRKELGLKKGKNVPMHQAIEDIT